MISESIKPLCCVVALLLFATLPACSKDPCVDCLDVAGSYLIEAEPNEPDQSSCGELYYSGFYGGMTIEQDESELFFVELGAYGTLYEDDSADFEAVETSIEPSGETAALVFSAGFSPIEDGGMEIEGYLAFRRHRDNCRMNAYYQGRRQ